MDELKDLKDLVRHLEVETDESKIVQILQKIGRKLVTEYEIKIKDVIITPITVEAYYYKSKTFSDCNTHLNSLQNKFNVLYRHSTKKGLKSDGRKGGVDICMALNENRDDNKCFLSFLIKNSLFNNEFCKQVDLNARLNKYFDEKDEISNVICKRKNTLNKICVFCKRKGLKKECYKEIQTAVSYPWESIEYKLDFSSEFDENTKRDRERGKQWRIAISNLERHNSRIIAEKENGSRIEDYYWNLANEDYNSSLSIENEIN